MDMLILRRRPVGNFEGVNIPVGASANIEAVFQDIPASDANGLGRDPDVLAAAEPMPLVLIEPVSAASGGTNAANSNSAWGLAAVGVTSNTAFTGKNVKVAVLDTGIDSTHPAFAGVNIIPRNFTQGNATDVTDTVGHGTHCAGTIFGRPVNGTPIGVAPGVETAIIGKVLESEAVLRALFIRRSTGRWTMVQTSFPCRWAWISLGCAIDSSKRACIPSKPLRKPCRR